MNRERIRNIAGALLGKVFKHREGRMTLGSVNLVRGLSRYNRGGEKIGFELKRPL